MASSIFPSKKKQTKLRLNVFTAYFSKHYPSTTEKASKFMEIDYYVTSEAISFSI